VRGFPSACTFPKLRSISFRLFTPGVACVSTWFNRHRATALGLVAAGSSIGGVIIPITFETLLQKVGFGWSFRCIALIQLFTLVIANLTLKSRLPPRKVGRLIELQAFRERSYTFFTIGLYLAFWGLYTPFFYCIAYAVQVQTPAGTIPYIIPLMNARTPLLL